MSSADNTSTIWAFSKLTPRQRQIVQRLAAGHKRTAIAKDLNISIKTVDAHRLHILARVGLKTTQQLRDTAASVLGL